MQLTKELEEGITIFGTCAYEGDSDLLPSIIF